MENMVKKDFEFQLLKKFYNNKVVFVTGATGFKGSWLCILLKKLGAKVIGYSLPPERKNDLFVKANIKSVIDSNHFDDIYNYDQLDKVFKKFKPEIVFHLAAQALVRHSYKQPKQTYQTNVMGSINLLELVRKNEFVKSFIYVTSDKVYKNKEWIWGYRENDELGGHDPYSASKAVAEIVFNSYLQSFFYENQVQGLASVRAGNVIGGGDWATDRIIPDCIRSISNDSTIEVRSPYAVRPWQHVLEPLSGYLLLAKELYDNPNKFKGSWNFGPNTSSVRTVKELTEKVIDIFQKGRINFNKNTTNLHEANLLHLNCDKSNQFLNWYPKWDFNNTIDVTVEWYKKFIDNKESALDLTNNDINKYFKL